MAQTNPLDDPKMKALVRRIQATANKLAQVLDPAGEEEREAAIQVLKKLEWSEKRARAAVSKLVLEPGTKADEIVRLALKK